MSRETLRSGTRTLSAAFEPLPARVIGSVAVAHPHPGHGGNMDHSVVRAVAQRAGAAGLAAMRFDVGGVRESEGDVLDWESHLGDLRAASDAAAESAPGLPRFGAGFSYGARLWIEALRRGIAPPVAGLVLLAPATKVPSTPKDFGALLLGRPIPGSLHDESAIDGLRALRVPARILVGEHDVVAPPHELRAAAPQGVEVVVLPALNHFFHRGVGGGAPDLAVLVPALDTAWAAIRGAALRG